MKYTDMNVFGYRRSGTHYITAVLSKNFFDKDGYIKYYQKHKIPNQFSFNNNTVYICVKRKFEDVAKSIFRMRKRFGLKINNYEDFLKTRYSDMWDSNVGKFTVKVDTIVNQKIVSKVGGGLRGVNLIPKDHWNQYYKLWKNTSAKNIKIINYEDFIENFDVSMIEMSNFLDSNGKEFINIEKKIGWLPI